MRQLTIYLQGKRKKSSRKPQGPKKVSSFFLLLVFGPYVLIQALKSEPLPTSFPCLFCNHDKSVQVKLDKKGGIGELSCKVCGQHFQSGINCKSDVQPMLDHPSEEQEL